MQMELTKEILNLMIAEAKDTFRQSSQSQKLKDILDNIDPLFTFNTRLRHRTYAQAGTVEYFCKLRKELGLTRSDKRYLIDGWRQHLVIEINPTMNNLTEEQVLNIVSHELAHCLDFILRGFEMNRKKRKGYHDEFWANLHRNMGGDGKELFEN